MDKYTQIRKDRTNAIRNLSPQDDCDDESRKCDTADCNTQVNIFAKESQMSGKKTCEYKAFKRRPNKWSQTWS